MLNWIISDILQYLKTLNCANKWLIVNILMDIIWKWVKQFNCVKKKWAQFRLIIFSTKCVEKLYIKYMYEKDLALNNLQWLICRKNQTKPTNFSEDCFFSSIKYMKLIVADELAKVSYFSYIMFPVNLSLVLSERSTIQSES